MRGCASAAAWCSVAVALALLAVDAGADPREHAFPGADWAPVTTAESAGYSSAGVEAARAFASQLGTTGLLVVASGRVLLEHGDVREVSYLASARKSVLAMLYGNAIARGKIRLGATLAELKIDDVGGLLSEEKQATVADLLTARSGVYHPAANPGDDLASAPPRGSQPHGRYFLYNNWDFNVLGTIFEQSTGRSIYDALATELAIPLGMQDFRREAQRKSGDARLSQHRAYHIHLSTRDMARLGYLMLRRGTWKGRQLIPAQWVARMTQRAVRHEDLHNERRQRNGLGYGFLWWIFDDAAARKGGALAGAYSAAGAFGQYITVIPKLDLVVAHKTRPEKARTVSTGQYRRLLDLLVEARARAPVTASPPRPPE